MDRLRDLTLEPLSTPLGDMLIVADGETVRAIDFADCEPRLRRMARFHAGRDLRDLAPRLHPSEAARRLIAYFAGDIGAIDAVAHRTAGTPFQHEVWAALRALPPGRPVTYGALAHRLGRPRASRAVGAANGANPVSIVIPCHRLTGSTGALHGYAGGLARKAWLLHHEASARN